MATEAVQPLNIVKTSTPGKPMRALSEIGSTEQRRNSPSYNQTTRTMINRDSSPFDSSPFHLKSPRLFWEDRATVSPAAADVENDPERSFSPEVSKRRSSIENLKRASRVKNSSMYARETKDNYDPSSSPMIERPLNNRPWGGHLQNNVFTRNDSLRKENSPIKATVKPPNRRSESTNDLPTMTPSNDSASSCAADASTSPRKDAPLSPMRSSLAANSRFSFPTEERAAWSDDDEDFRASTPRAQPRHAKSVTFQNSPPEVNEYEEQTPEPSSVASGSREGSYDSYDDDDDDDDEEDDEEEEEEEEDGSFSHDDAGHNEDSFDASLEDTDKTPVVLPDDWRHASPDTARKDLVDDYDDVFEERGRGSPAPTATPLKGQRPPPFRTDSGASHASDGSDFRPLPPIPGFASPRRGRNESPRGLAMAAERASSLQRGLPTPPRAASVSKDEILRMREATMNLEDRMGLMALQESLSDVYKTRNGSNSNLAPPAEISEKAPADRELTEQHETHEDSDHDLDHDSESEYLDDLHDFDVAPSISRESILRNVKSNRFHDYDEYADDHSALSSPGRDYAELANLDPDVAIPSRENSTNFGQDVVIKEEEDSFMELDAIPALMADDDFEESPARMDDHERQSSVIHHQVEDVEESDSHYDDEESRYSSPMSEAPGGDASEGPGTPRASAQPMLEDDAFLTPLEGANKDEHSEEKSLPLLGLSSSDEYDFGLKEYITPSPPSTSHGETAEPRIMTTEAHEETNSVVNPPELFKPMTNSSLEERPHTPIEEGEDLDFSDAESFDSAIRDSITEDMLPIPEQDIPERRATIKTQGKLRARPSGTPADLQAMIQQRRQVSVEVPPIPDQYRVASLSGSEASETDYMDTELDNDESQTSEAPQAETASDDVVSEQADSFMDKEKRRQSHKQLKLDLDLPTESSSGLGLMEEFDRVIESQKKGYLTRHNTKVVIASNRNFSNESQMSQRPMSPPQSPGMESKPSTRGTRSAGNSPRKSSGGEKWLTAEPWNGKTRRKSTRRSSGRRSNIGIASPVVAQEKALRTVDELTTTDEADENTERGRLFVKVVGVKDLDLPLPRNDRLYFQLTLDNGLHCVTTANLELNKSAPVGQEFELVVLTDLEFQLTLTTKLPPAPRRQEVASAPAAAPTSPTKSAKSGSVFSRLLASPKKRAERERKEKEELELAERRRREEIERKRASVPKPTPWDFMREVVDAKTGSFARSYVSLKSHEGQCFGRPLTVDVPCFNEWALEKDANVVSSVRSKRNNGGLAYGRADGAIRRPPYVVGKLELQLLYIPRPKSASDEDMPKSMSSAIREMKAAEQVKEAFWEGCLSQQGGDCPYWRRRYFKLQGTKLTAYHEATMQPRATINLSKANRLIDDKCALVADPNGGKPTSKNRRKSAFAEDDEGYQFVEDGFRIRFANGETIDFYADNVAQKEGWMKALAQSVGKAPVSKQAKWTDVVLAKERLDGKSNGDATTDHRKPSGESQNSASTARSAPNSPMLMRSNSSRPGTAPSVPAAEGDTTPPMRPRMGHRDRSQVKSMIF
ncbi:hypothetical protein AAFC00_005848 [Neodothiora populina]|uniref:PH domain-containing protein n=1 Tax=Neodothiora populina TaxID=2781224 RepID=A0ABR3P617_9PEZI